MRTAHGNWKLKYFTNFFHKRAKLVRFFSLLWLNWCIFQSFTLGHSSSSHIYLIIDVLLAVKEIWRSLLNSPVFGLFFLIFSFLPPFRRYVAAQMFSKLHVDLVILCLSTLIRIVYQFYSHNKHISLARLGKHKNCSSVGKSGKAHGKLTRAEKESGKSFWNQRCRYGCSSDWTKINLNFKVVEWGILTTTPQDFSISFRCWRFSKDWVHTPANWHWALKSASELSKEGGDTFQEKINKLWSSWWINISHESLMGEKKWSEDEKWFSQRICVHWRTTHKS